MCFIEIEIGVCCYRSSPPAQPTSERKRAMFQCPESLRPPHFAHCPTPSVWPKGGTPTSVGGPCLSGASWTALLKLVSLHSQKARRGVTWFWPLLPKQKCLACLGETRPPPSAKKTPPHLEEIRNVTWRNEIDSRAWRNWSRRGRTIARGLELR